METYITQMTGSIKPTAQLCVLVGGITAPKHQALIDVDGNLNVTREMKDN